MTDLRTDDAPAAAQAYDAPGEAKRLLRAVRAGALATLAPSGHPFASLVNVATDVDGSPLLLLSRLAVHTVNLDRDPRCSILLAEGGKGDPLAHPRLTVAGLARRVAEDEGEGAMRARFLRRHPKAALYAGFQDFGLWRVEVAWAHLNGGFARAADFDAPEVLTSIADAHTLVDAEVGAVEHMNRDHADALSVYAGMLGASRVGGWRATGVDPEGLDLLAGDETARLRFPVRVTTPGGLRETLVRLAQAARSRPLS